MDHRSASAMHVGEPEMELMLVSALVTVLVCAMAATTITIVPAGHVDVVERLGRYLRTAGPGLSLRVPGLDHVRRRHTLAEVAVPVPVLEAVTQDDHVVALSGILRLAVRDPYAATYHVEDHLAASVQITHNVWRELVATLPLEEARASRGRLSQAATPRVNQAATAWGVDVRSCEIVDLTGGGATRDL